MLRIAVLAVLLSVAASQKREEDGIMYENSAHAIRPYSTPMEMLSIGYPDEAPHDIVQTWRWVAFDNNDNMQKRLRVWCKQMYTRESNGDKCEENTLTLRDGDNEEEICGDVHSYSYLSSTSDITFTMKTGPNGGGVIGCKVQAVHIDENGQEITTTTTSTTTTTTVKPTYMHIETEEIDSSEDGGAPGAKKTTCNCGWANKVATRIVNGTETNEHEFPFAAGLVYKEWNWRFCGATIVTTWHALTAAHCTVKKTARDLGLLIGEHDVTDEITGPTEVVPILVIVEHHEYTPGIFTNDIALLVLEREIKFSQFVGPACLPRHQLDLQGQYIKIIGWGANQFKGEQSNVLKKVNVRVVNRKECNVMYRDVSWEEPTQICTYRTRRASCQGDSGGPVVWLDPETNRYTHVGIVSFGRICGDISPSVHTDVGAYLDWIEHFIKVSKPGQICMKEE